MIRLGKNIRTLFVMYLLFVLLTVCAYSQTKVNNKAIKSSGLESVFSYQAVLRDNQGMVMANTDVAITIYIRKKTSDGEVLYTENHNVKTNKFGLIDILIGNANEGDGIDNIDWSDGPYFIEVAVGGRTLGTSKILSVPIAVYAAVARKFIKGDYNNLLNPLDLKTFVTKPDVENMMAKIPVSEQSPEGSLIGQVYYNTNTGTVFSFDGSVWKPIEASSGDIFSKQFSELLSENSSAGNNKISELSVPEDAQDAATKKYVDDKVAFSSSATYISNTEPESPSLGFVYMNSIDNRLYYWNGTEWLPVGMSGQIFKNMLVVSSSAGDHYIKDLPNPVDDNDAANKRYTDNAISAIDNSTPVGSAPPQDPGIGDIYYKTTDKLLYYFDGTDWVKMGGSTVLLSSLLSDNSDAQTNKISNLGAPSEVNDAVRKTDVDNTISSAPQEMETSDTHPDDALLGEIYFNTTERSLYYYNGTDWVKLNSESLIFGDIIANDNDAGGNKITSLADPVDDNDAANVGYVNTKIDGTTATTASGNVLPDSGLSGELFFNTSDNKLYYYNSEQWLPIESNSSLLLSTILGNSNSAGGNRITGVANPNRNQDAINKGYVDALKGGTQVYFKEKVFTVGFDGNWNNEMIHLWRTAHDKTISITEVRAYAIGQSNAQVNFSMEIRANNQLGSAGTKIFTDQSATSEGNKIRSFNSGSNINIPMKSHIVFVTGADAGVVETVNSIKIVVYYQE
jgi:hypothetical protein